MKLAFQNGSLLIPLDNNSPLAERTTVALVPEVLSPTAAPVVVVNNYTNININILINFISGAGSNGGRSWICWIITGILFIVLWHYVFAAMPLAFSHFLFTAGWGSHLIPIAY